MMSKLEKLIQQYCPDGVEYHKVKDVYKRLKGTPITAGKMKEIANADGQVRVFAGGRTIIDANETDIPNANITKVPAVLVQSRGVIDVVYYDKPFTFKNEMWAYTTKNQVSVKFLYYVLKVNIQKFRDAASGMGSLPQISLGVTEEFEIPVPPLPVQEEIVKILDKFTLLSAELEAELEGRRKQFDFYRNQLLSFDSGSAPVQWKKLDSVASHYTGLTYKPSDVSKDNEGTLVLRSSNIKDEQINFEDNVFVKVKNIPERALAKEGDILICVRNGSKRLIGKAAIVPKLEKPMAFGAFMTVLRAHSICGKYLYYLWQSEIVKKQLGIDDSMPINQITNREFSKILIPILPLSEQQRIVDILDRFDALTNDLTSGLPAEIEKRKKQYEYYRDRLLKFKVKS